MCQYEGNGFMARFYDVIKRSLSLIKTEFMQLSGKKRKLSFLENFSAQVTKATGSNAGFLIAITLIISWAAAGPAFDFSDTWKWVISIGTSMVTFLMVFLLQKSQNKDSLAIQLKLNELLAAHELASNRLVNVEGMTEDEMKTIQKYYSKLSELAMKEDKMQQSHSIDGSHELHHLKNEMEDELKKKLDKE
jgi:low affinity Fe/Cu permease